MGRLLVASVVAVVAGALVSLGCGGPGSGAGASGRWMLKAISFEPGVYARPMYLNERGDILGRGSELERTLVWTNGEWHSISPPPGTNVTWPAGMNDRGEVIAQACSGQGFCDYPRSKTARSFLWESGHRLTDLGTLGGRSTRVWGINNKGEIVGSSDTRAQHVRAVLWRNGKLVDLGTLGGKHSGAVAINQRGQILGWSEISARKATRHLFLWEHGRMTDLDIEVDRAWWVYQHFPFINEQGHITGYMNGCGEMCGFFWRDDKLHTFNRLYPLGLNNQDQIPVLIPFRNTEGGQMAVWRNGALTRLGRNDYAPASRRIINDRGQIVVMDSERSRGLVWENGRRTYLPAYVPDPRRPYKRYSDVVAINNRNQILGAGDYRESLLWAWQPAR